MPDGPGPPCSSNICSEPGLLCSRGGRFLSGARRRLDAVSVRSILNGNQFQIVRREDFPFRVLHFHSNRFSGAFVQNLKTFLAAGEEITFSPLAQSNDNRKQLSAFLGQGIFPVGTAVRSRHLFQDFARNQLLKARAQDVLCQSQALLKIGEASYAREGVTNDQQRPPFADGIERACHRAQVGFEGFVSHISSCLISRNSSCIIIPDSGILCVVASCNQNTRAKLKLKGGIHTNEKHREGSGSLRTDDEKRAQEKFDTLRRRSSGGASQPCRRPEPSSGCRTAASWSGAGLLPTPSRRPRSDGPIRW